MSAPPYEIDALFQRAWQAQTDGQFEIAMALYRQILALGEHAQAWLGIGQCHLDRQERIEALAAFRKAAALLPQSGAIRHMVDMLEGGRVPDRAPDDYVLWVFDGHADNFDTHLAALNYRGPQMIASLVKNVWTQNRARAILDLGCGTGLNGPMFQPYAGRLDGVDLAPRMLQQSARRQVYDHLYRAEVHDFLRRPPVCYDAILSTDVFIYIGRLDELFMYSFQYLNPGGELLFTIELGADDGPEISLMPTGRFRQSDAYIRRLANASEFEIAATADGVLRIEEGVPEPGRAYRLISRREVR
ncbi:MAG: class I SAM-dependent DNA methyltransferase [Ferrovibrio sp.]